VRDGRLARGASARHTRLVDASLLLAGVAGVGGYGYLRPTELFRHVVGARLRLAGMRSQRLQLTRARVRVWRGGRGDPVVFVHGFGTEASINWNQQLPAACRRFTVVAPDLPGFGASDRIGDEHTITFQVACLHEMLTRLGYERVRLVGHSMGGWISLAFAAEHPELVARLVVVDAAGLRFDPDLSLQRVLLPETADDARDLIAANFRRPPRLPRFVLRDVVRTCRREFANRAEILRQLVYGAEYLDDRLASIAAPTLIVWGRSDPITPVALAERLVAGIADAELVVFDDCAHSPNLEQPARFNRLLFDFLAGARATRAPRAALAASA